MLGHLEEAARHHGRLVLVAQQGAKVVYITMPQPGRDDRAVWRAEAVEVGARIEERAEHAPVGVEQRFGPRRDAVEVAERGDAQPLRRVRRDAAEDVVQAPDSPRQLRLGQYPTATQAAQAISLGQAARRHEL